MSIRAVHPYLNFNGEAPKAIAHYTEALGAKAEGVMRFSDMPGQNVPPEAKDRVLHALLHVGSGSLMLSDMPVGQQVPPGGNTHVSLHLDDPKELEQKFNALARGGKVTLPLQDTFWGAKFGMLTDAFGINWMFNCELKKGQS